MRRRNSTIALTLIIVLGIGPVLTLAASEKSPGAGISHSRSAPIRSRAPRNPKPMQMPTLLEGQTATTLPDARILLIGGLGEDGPISAITIQNPRTGKIKSLSNMRVGRAWHTATMLPDGRVFVFGGITADERVLRDAFIIDPTTASIEDVKGESGLTPRVHHSATLLTDGRVLIAGGLSARGEPIIKAQLWDYQTQQSAFAGSLTLSRSSHMATLLADGNVVLEGGVDENNAEIKNAELFNVDAKSFSVTSISSEDDKDATPYVAASLPADGATEVPVESRVALRFSRPLPSEAVKLGTIKLEATDEGVAAKIVLAENGRLVFITPLESLRKGTSYKVAVTNSLDGSVSITPASVSFTTVADKDWGNRNGNETDWVPRAENLRGNWRTKGEKSEWEDQPPLQAEGGKTALSGLVLTLKGQPLSNVTISVKGETTRTDRTGRFLLQAVDDGHQVMLIDGRTASRPGSVYGIFRAGVEITANKTNVLPFTVWMPKLDMAHAVKIPSPIKKEVVITNPLIPGLELHLPAGTVIRDLDGKAVTELSITPVPTDRPPFPLPRGFKVPVFASIQPGGARVIPPRARLIYPNYINERPGARVNFWNYDPEGKGWYVYGQGTVSKNGKQIIPDPGVVVYEFTGIMWSAIKDWLFNSSNPGNSGNNCCDPVDTSTGLFVQRSTDLAVPDILPITLERTYRPEDSASRSFGIGARQAYDMNMSSTNNYQEVDLSLPDGGHIHYVRISPGTGFADAVYEHTTTPSVFYKSRISWNNGWELRLKDGTVFFFPEYSPLQWIRDRYGNQLTITRAEGVLGNITQITSPNGRWIQFTYDSSDRITQAKDNNGRTVSYTYDSGGRLWKVTDPMNGVTEYTYDSSDRMLTLKDARGILYLTNEYDSSGRVISQTQADDSTYQIDYTVDSNDAITQADITDPRGYVRRVTFNSDGYTISQTFGLGTSEEQTYNYVRQSGTNLLLSMTDALSRTTSFTYDAMGNLASVTRLSGTSAAVTTTLTHEPNFNQVATVTDPLNHATTFGYDVRGNLNSISDPLNHQTTLTYNTDGQPLSVTDPLNHTIQFTYDSGDLVGITDPLGGSVAFLLDGIGRPATAINPLGQQTRYQYDALNRLTQSTDPLQGVTAFDYDENGNLLSLTDARNSVTSYVYDNMDRVTTRQDPLLHDETYEYDLNGNPIEVTDRKSQVTSYEYDPLNRLTEITYDDSSTTSFSYDDGSRVTEIVDSISGTTTLAYDDLDRLTSKTTPQGTISYTYDDAGRRTSMTVTGQSTVNYTYDNADRLTQITKGSATVTIAYDNANRRTSLTLPTGVISEYGYDAASQLTGITYKYGTSTLGNLSYTYDAAGRRTTVGGSYARSGLPSAVASPTPTYNAANQQTAFGSQTLSYDLNGNLTSDGTNTYSWNARDQLASISASGLAASFQYDAFGSRVSKTVNSTTVTYLHDGANVVQEQSGGSPSANLLTGGLDEVFTRTDGSGTYGPLFDGLGSALAVTNSSGAVQTEYTYEPFGATSVSGSANSNVTQYSGRENDGTGLYYYRARYYSPSLHRFISQDPIGFAGGINLYAYVDNNPIGYRDPFGLDKSGEGYGIVSGISNFVNGVFDFVKNKLLPAACAEPLAPMMGAIGPALPKILGRGSTADVAKGTSLPRNLPEQMAIEQAAANPAAGTKLPLTMSDPRWPSAQGWEKMQQMVDTGAQKINVHYVRNALTGELDDFKIVLPGPRP